MQYDFAIVGAGIAGASLAAELSGQARVLVLEAEDQPGYHATGRSAAFWDECYGGPSITPLTLASGPYLNAKGVLRRRGALYLGRGNDQAQLDQFLSDFADSGATLERHSRAQIDQRVRGIKPEWDKGIWAPHCSDIDVSALHADYVAQARAHGAQLELRAKAERIERAKDRWTITVSDGRSFSAKTIVNAAGAWADELAAKAGAAPIGITPLRRTVVQLRTDPMPPDDLPLVLDIEGKFYFKSEAGRLWLSPHDETPSAPCDAAAEEIDIATAIERFGAVCDWTITKLEHRWAGLRSFAPDRLPAYGFDPQLADFAWFAGQGGFGIQTSPAAARLMAQLLLGMGPDEVTQGLSQESYSPRRFLENTAA
jgi:D-arginine dehydrogenase